MPINTDFWLKWMPDKYISASLWFQMMENSTVYNQKMALNVDNWNWKVTCYTRYTSLNKRNAFSFGYHFRLFFFFFKYWTKLSAKIQSWQRNHDIIGVWFEF